MSLKLRNPPGPNLFQSVPWNLFKTAGRLGFGRVTVVTLLPGRLFRPALGSCPLNLLEPLPGAGPGPAGRRPAGPGRGGPAENPGLCLPSRRSWFGPGRPLPPPNPGLPFPPPDPGLPAGPFPLPDPGLPAGPFPLPNPGLPEDPFPLPGPGLPAGPFPLPNPGLAGAGLLLPPKNPELGLFPPAPAPGLGRGGAGLLFPALDGAGLPPMEFPFPEPGRWFLPPLCACPAGLLDAGRPAFGGPGRTGPGRLNGLLGLGPNRVETIEGLLVGGGGGGLGRLLLLGTNLLLLLFLNPSDGLGRNGLGRPLMELGPLERVADENPDGMTEATSFWMGGGGRRAGCGRAVVKAGTALIKGATVVLTKSTTALVTLDTNEDPSALPKA